MKKWFEKICIGLIFFLSALYFNNACYSDDNVNVSLFTISNENFGAV